LKTVLVLAFTLVVALLAAAPPALAAEAPAQAAGQLTLVHGLIALSAALAVAFGAIGTAWAMSRIGAAAAGAMAERPEVGGLLLVFLALPETMIIFGFLVAFFLIGKI
jgi:V/A-type H+-transporting ATPase subunit K